MRTPSLFNQLLKDSKKEKETNDCTVFSICVATGLDYKTVHRALMYSGRRHRRGCSPNVMEGALRRLGFKHTALKSWKGKTFTSIKVPRDKNYIVFSCDHAAGVKFGLIKDWASEKRLRVTGLWEITPISKISTV